MRSRRLIKFGRWVKAMMGTKGRRRRLGIEEYMRRPYRMEIYYDEDYWAVDAPTQQRDRAHAGARGTREDPGVLPAHRGQLVDPETMPHGIVGWLGHPGVEARLGQDPALPPADGLG